MTSGRLVACACLVVSVVLMSLSAFGLALPHDLPNQSPVPVITAWPKPAVVGQPLTFSAGSSTDPDGRIVWYGWDWNGDGVVDSTVYEVTQQGGTRAYAWDAANDGVADGVNTYVTNYNQTYTSPGKYVVMLRVRDDDDAEAMAGLVVTVTAAPNKSPEAQYTWSGTRTGSPHAGTLVSFDGSQSRDSDGRITGYEWDWTRDGTYDEASSSPFASHVFSAAGSYRVRLRVKDDDGANDTVSHTINVLPANEAPGARYTWRGVASDGSETAVPCAGDSIQFDGSGSTDVDGQIASYAWDWTSDGTYESTGSAVSYVFDAAGSYRVTLRVTDDDGAEATTSQVLAIAPANATPAAKFAWGAVAADGGRVVVEPRRGDTIRFDARESADVDGEIVAYAWDWESEGVYEWTGTEPVVSYMFPEAGMHRVTLRVTDDDGATATTSQVVKVDERRGPTAAMTFAPESPSTLDMVQFADASESGDQPVVSWHWAFGDGAESTEQHPTHQYTTKGLFTVTLTVMDADEETSQTTETLEVVNVPPTAAANVEPENGSVGWVLTFDASGSTDTDGEIVSFAWDWDSDGLIDATSVEPVAQHAFLAAGMHWVTLVVTDNGGVDGAQEIAVTVSEEPVVVEPQGVWAVVVGISDYADVRKLTYARADAEAFAAWLGEAGVADSHVMTLYDEQATLVKVRAALGWLRRSADPDDLVFFYFAGHGYQGEDDDGDDSIDGLDEFLALYDTQADAVDETGLRDDEFGRFLDQVDSQHVMVVFDSCFSGGQERSLPGSARPLGDTFDLLTDFSLEGKLVLAAASESQESKEHSSLEHGVFTYFLLQGLAGAADDDDDFRITADELFRYTQPRVADFVRRTFGKNQNPELSGRGMPGIVLSQLNRPPLAEFVVEPLAPSMSVPTRFVDTSSDDRTILSWQWTFGDGSESTEQHPVHLYAEAKTYVATLTVVDEEGLEGKFEQSVAVGPLGEVRSPVTNGEMMVSLGGNHGVAPGDRFEVVRIAEGSSGQQIVERKAVVEIVRVDSAVRSVARIVSQEFPVELHDLLLPAQP